MKGEDQLKTYPISAKFEKKFCADCGTTLGNVRQHFIYYLLLSFENNFQNVLLVSGGRAFCGIVYKQLGRGSKSEISSTSCNLSSDCVSQLREWLSG